MPFQSIYFLRLSASVFLTLLSMAHGNADTLSKPETGQVTPGNVSSCSLEAEGMRPWLLHRSIAVWPQTRPGHPDSVLLPSVFRISRNGDSFQRICCPCGCGWFKYVLPYMWHDSDGHKGFGRIQVPVRSRLCPWLHKILVRPLNVPDPQLPYPTDEEIVHRSALGRLRQARILSDRLNMVNAQQTSPHFSSMALTTWRLVRWLEPVEPLHAANKFP